MSDEKQANPLFRDAMANLGAAVIVAIMVMQDAVV